ncbi:ribonuclease P [archaeon]|mgnify:CR=1 FL=1|nr:ribonuclease P [archaeon]|tara:strand:+ start:109 stop:405 length:297 start_codon:yes stop_codon:yes gene_type:complete
MKKQEIQKIALERIKILFKEADKSFSKHPERSNRYVKLARKIAMKVNLSIPSTYKRKFCKHCYSYLKIGSNARKRIRDKKIIYYCMECKKFNRIPYKR